MEHAWLNFDDIDNESDAYLNDIYSHSMSYRIAVGKHKGRKILQLHSVSNDGETNKSPWYLAKYSGFSLHAGIGDVRAPSVFTTDELFLFTNTNTIEDKAGMLP